MLGTREEIEAFFHSAPFAVVGASADRTKFGYKVLAALLCYGFRAYPVNPRGGDILGQPAAPNLAALPEPVRALSIITPPAVTERVVQEAIRCGVQHVWMQPGAESDTAIRLATEAGLTVIAAGPCVLVELARRQAT